jgi:hypothetical protein
MIELRNNYWAVEVPSMAFGFDVNNYGDESEYMYMLDVEDIIDEPHSDETLITKKLPPGTWEIVCTSKEASVIQSMEIVEQEGNYFKDYDKDRFHHDIPFSSPIDSLNSLLTAKGCDLNNNYLILKKQ